MLIFISFPAETLNETLFFEPFRNLQSVVSKLHLFAVKRSRDLKKMIGQRFYNVSDYI